MGIPCRVRRGERVENEMIQHNDLRQRRQKFEILLSLWKEVYVIDGNICRKQHQHNTPSLARTTIGYSGTFDICLKYKIQQIWWLKCHHRWILQIFLLLFTYVIRWLFVCYQILKSTWNLANFWRGVWFISLRRRFWTNLCHIPTTTHLEKAACLPTDAVLTTKREPRQESAGF